MVSSWRQKALQSGWEFQEVRLIQRALSAFLERHDEALVTAALNEVYRAQPAAKLDPVLDRIQRLSLRRDKW